MIDEKTLEWEYYLKKLPLYLQNSYGFSEHFRNLYQIMIDTNRCATDLLRALNIISKNYFINLDLSLSPEEASTNVSVDGRTFDLLDKIASLYNVNRNFDVEYSDNEGNIIHKSLSLNNFELLTLILVKVVQNNYLGTYEDVRKLYDLIDLPIFLYNANDSANVYLILNKSSKNSYSENIRDMFYANLLTIKSLGINYIHLEIKEKGLSTWDSTEADRLWDFGVWG